MADLLRIGIVAAALGMSVSALQEWEAQGRVTFVRRGGRRMLPASDLAALVQSQRQTTVGNQLSGVVTSVARDGLMAEVVLSCDGQRIVALVSDAAVDELGLEPGRRATAVIQTNDVIVERE